MRIPPARELIGAVGALPGGAQVLERLAGTTGVHLVGGAVRDLLLRRPPRELDLVVEGEVEPIAARLGGEVRSHSRFGTSTVSSDGFSYDLARARRETYDHPGALPSVSPATLPEDLLRRDFTVNAMAIGLTGDQAGLLTAAPDALDDLAAGRLRVLHDASFRDDPTRLLRLVRYAARLGFAVEPHTQELITQALAGDPLGDVSGARIGNELRLLAREADPVTALGELASRGLAGAISEDLHAPDRELAGRAFGLLPADGRHDLLALALAFDEAADRERLAAALDRLAFEAPDRTTILAAVTRGRALAGALAAATRPSDIAAAVAGAGPELVALAGALGAAEPAEAWLTSLRHIGLEIDGEDLLRAGIGQGPAVGRGLRAALAAKLDGQLAGADEELLEALRAASTSG